MDIKSATSAFFNLENGTQLKIATVLASIMHKLVLPDHY